MFHPTLSKTGRFLFAPVITLCEYLGKHHPEFLLKIRYLVAFKKRLNLKNPNDLNEKILWAKLYSDTSQWSVLADKMRVREYVEGLGLQENLVKLYAVWDNADNIDFQSSMLPNAYILKANNGDGKGTNQVVADKTTLNSNDLKQLHDTTHRWLTRKNIGMLSAEPHYDAIPPRIIAEELLPFPEGSTSLTDYKIWCFNGKAQFIFICAERDKGGISAHIMVYDRNWNAHPEYCIFSSEYQECKPIPRPKNLERMLQIAERLSQGFPELRVDLYNIEPDQVDGKIFFGELTFTSQGGLMDYFTPEFLLELGSKFSIGDFPKKQ